MKRFSSARRNYAIPASPRVIVSLIAIAAIVVILTIVLGWIVPLLIYVLGAVVQLILYVISLRNLVSLRNVLGGGLQGQTLLAASTGMMTSNPLTRWRLRLQSLISYLGTVLTWPALLPAIITNTRFSLQGRNADQYMAYHTLFEPLTMFIPNFILVLIIGLVGAIVPPGEIALLLLQLMLIGLLFLLGAVLLRPGQIVQSFRVAETHTLITFLLFAAIVFATVTLNLALIASWSGAIPNLITAGVTVIRNILSFDFSSLRTYLVDPELISNFTVLMTVSGLIFSLAILSVFTRSIVGDLKITTEDLRAKATYYIVLGDFSRALEWLEQIPIAERTMNANMLLMAACLGSGKPDRALGFATQLPLYDRGETRDMAVAVIFRELLIYPISVKLADQFILAWLAAKPEDAPFSAALMAVANRTKQNLSNDIDLSALPLTAAIRQILNKDNSAAFQSLSLMRPRTAFEAFMADFVRLIALDEDDLTKAQRAALGDASGISKGDSKSVLVSLLKHAERQDNELSRNYAIQTLVRLADAFKAEGLHTNYINSVRTLRNQCQAGHPLTESSYNVIDSAIRSHSSNSKKRSRAR
jgi:hypothetical protein